MNIKPLIMIACLGVAAALISSYIYNENHTSLPPVAVSYNPYENGVYASGIVESYQPTGSNINIYPEVSDRVTQILVKDGQTVHKGDMLFTINDSPQREIVQKDIALTEFDKTNILNTREQLDKIVKAYNLDHKSVSQNTLDNALNALNLAQDTLNVDTSQMAADQATLDKYTVKAPIDGIILRVVPSVGDYVSPQGSYDPTTQRMLPSVQMGVVTPYLQVRAYVDEILVPHLPVGTELQATMLIRGLNNKKIPLEFVSIQPYTIPNIELSNNRTEQVDVRVLPVVFRFKKPADINIFPGQLVDVYLKGKS